MSKLNILTLAVCCAVVVLVVSAYPSYPVTGDFVGPYQDEEASLDRLRVAREAAADPQHRGRGRGRGHGHGRFRPQKGFGGQGGLGGQGGFGTSNAGSQANSASFSQTFSSPFGTFSASSSQSSANSFANTGFGGRG